MIPPLIDFVACVSPNVLLSKLELIIFGANSSIKLEYFFPRGSNWRFFPLSWKLVSISTWIPKIRSLLCVDREILSMEFFFHKNGIFISSLIKTPNFKLLLFQSQWSYRTRTKTNEIFQLFCSRICLLIALLPVHGQLVDD